MHFYSKLTSKNKTQQKYNKNPKRTRFTHISIFYDKTNCEPYYNAF